jgi:hypothetical protein
MAAQHACSAAATSPAHGRRRGERHGGASPARGRRRGRARDIDSGARMAWWRGEGDGTTAYRAVTATSERGRRRRRRRGVDNARARAARWRPARRRRERPVSVGGMARLDTHGWERTAGRGFEQQRSTTREARRRSAVGASAWSGRAVGRRLYGAARASVTRARGSHTETAR